jgi:hypothetical protein
VYVQYCHIGRKGPEVIHYLCTIDGRGNYLNTRHFANQLCEALQKKPVIIREYYSDRSRHRIEGKKIKFAKFTIK